MGKKGLGGTDDGSARGHSVQLSPTQSRERVKGGTPLLRLLVKKENFFAKAAGIFEGASKYISTRTEKGRDADGASESAEALTSVHVLPQ